MEITEIRLKRDALEDNIKALVDTFIQEVDIEISDIKFQPAVFNPNPPHKTITESEITVELII